jgi:hydrogenase expression/formation protein HypE
MPPTLGKLSPDDLESLILPRLGASRPEVLMGPRAGADAAIVRLGAGRVLALTTDPLSLIPALGPATSARLAAHLVASDLWTSGIPPAYVTVNLNLPPAIEDELIAEFTTALDSAWKELGVAVVAGHSGRYAGLDGTILGAATMIGVGDEGRYVTAEMAVPGDRVIVTGGCAIEATAIAAHLMPKRLGAKLEPDQLARARALLDQVTVVPACRALVQAGVRDRGVSAMHDATEGGVLGGLIELALASGHDLRIERARIPISDESRAACEAWGGIDPYWTLSEGTLIATVREAYRDAALAALFEAGIVAADVGEVMPGHGKLWLTAESGEIATFEHPEPDPYWPAYERAVREKWS